MGLSHPLPLNFLPTPEPFPIPMFRDPRPLGLEFLATRLGAALTLGLQRPEQCSEAVLYCVSAGLCSHSPSPFAVLFALMGRQVSNTMDGCRWWERGAVSGQVGDLGTLPAASVAEETCSAVDSLCTLSVFVG